MPRYWLQSYLLAVDVIGIIGAAEGAAVDAQAVVYPLTEQTDLFIGDIDNLGVGSQVNGKGCGTAVELPPYFMVEVVES